MAPSGRELARMRLRECGEVKSFSLFLKDTEGILLPSGLRPATGVGFPSTHGVSVGGSRVAPKMPPSGREGDRVAVEGVRRDKDFYFVL